MGTAGSWFDFVYLAWFIKQILQCFLSKLFPLQCLNVKALLNVLPLSFCFVGMVALANLCLKHVHVSTYQVARSLTIIFTVCLSYAVLHQSQSKPILTCCGVMIIGFIISSLDGSEESGINMTGLLAGGTSSFFQALYQVFIKRTLPYTDSNVNLLLLYNLFISSVLFVPVVFLLGESSALSHLPLFGDENFWVVWPCLVISGVLGTLINLATYMCINVTSPLTFNIVGFTKSCVQSIGGVVILGDTISFQSGTGIILTLLSSGWYTKLKFNEQKSGGSSGGGVSRIPLEDDNEDEESTDDEEEQKTYETTSSSRDDDVEMGEVSRLMETTQIKGKS